MLAVISVVLASAVITGNFEGIEEEFRVSEVVTALSVSSMVCGFGYVQTHPYVLHKQRHPWKILPLPTLIIRANL